jgi:hypothetical protein
MKEDLRMNAKSPDPDDLSGEELPQPDAADNGATTGRRRVERVQSDRSAPHIPPLEKGRIRGEQ